jgi:6-pyruvoyltetrahydropterin/6-carboxytetrahydropterin synthase
MRCRLVRDFRFEAAHALPNVPDGHKCKRVHGHSYRVSIIIEGDIVPGLGWVMDFSDVDLVVDPVIAEIDHQLLNDIDGLDNPTSELLAVWLWQRIGKTLPLMVELSVSETPDSRCIYRGEE